LPSTRFEKMLSIEAGIYKIYTSIWNSVHACDNLSICSCRRITSILRFCRDVNFFSLFVPRPGGMFAGTQYVPFFADRTICRAFGTLCRLSVCNVLYCGKTVRPSEKLSEGVNRKPGSKSWFFGSPPFLHPVLPLRPPRRPFLPSFCPYSPAIDTRWHKLTF